MFSVFKKYDNSSLKTRRLDEVSQTKRLLFKGAATAGVAFAALGGWVGIRAKNKDKKNYQAAYDQDVLPGDKILKKNGFEEISKNETEAMVKMFIDDYKHKKQA